MQLNMSEHKKELQKIAELVRQEIHCGRIIDQNNTAWVRKLEEQIAKTGEKFTVQIVGIFNSGKSSLLNAMLGEELLPTGGLPETGVLTELVYGEAKRITLYPKKGRWTSDEPFLLLEATTEEIHKYCSIDNQSLLDGESDQATSCFEKMIIEWPMPMLKDGIVLVDSVGLNDPWGNDEITKNYFPRTDAVIYLINCGIPFSGEDKATLTELNRFGIDNIIIGATHFGTVETNYRRNPERLSEFMDAVRKHCANYTRLGEGAVHFLDSLDAMDGKLIPDEQLLIKSGLPEFEKYLNQYMVNDKGRAQVETISAVMQRNADEMTAEAEFQNRTGRMEKDDFMRIIRNEKERIQLAKIQKDNISKSFRMGMKYIYPTLDDMVEKFASDLPQKLDLEGFTPQTVLPVGTAALNPFASRRASKSFGLECKTELQRRARTITEDWIQDTLLPYIDQEVRNNIEGVRPELEHFIDLITTIDKELTGGKVSVNASAAKILEAWAAGGLLSALITGIYGSEAGGRILAADGIILAGAYILALLAVPISLPALVIVTVIGNIIAVASGDASYKANKAKAAILKEVRRELKEKYENKDKESGKTQIETMQESSHNMIEKLCDEVDRILNEDLERKNQQIEQTINNYEMGIDARIEAEQARNGAIQQLGKILDEMKQIEKQYGI